VVRLASKAWVHLVLSAYIVLPEHDKGC
jgi:hypothetical protein